MLPHFLHNDSFLRCDATSQVENLLWCYLIFCIITVSCYLRQTCMFVNLLKWFCSYSLFYAIECLSSYSVLWDRLNASNRMLIPWSENLGKVEWRAYWPGQCGLSSAQWICRVFCSLLHDLCVTSIHEQLELCDTKIIFALLLVTSAICRCKLCSFYLHRVQHL